MSDEEKTRKQLIEELKSLRQQLAGHKKLESENRWVTRELREKEALATSIIDGIPDMLIVVDPADFRIVAANRAYLEKEGLTLEDVVGRTCYEVTHKLSEPCMPPNCKCPMYETVKTGKTVMEEHLHYNKHGERYWAEIITAPLFDDKKRLSRVLHISRDITDRKLAEEALRESEKKFRAIAASAHDGIIMEDDEGKVTYWNRAAGDMFGYSAAEAAGKALHELIIPQRYREDYLKGFKKFRKTGRGPAIGKTLCLTAIRKDGTEFPIELSLSAIKIKDKWNAIGVVRDITERKRMEETLRESEMRLRGIMDNSNAVIYLKDTQGRYIMVNRLYEELFHVSRGEIVGKTDYDIFPKEIADAFRANDRKVLEAGAPLKLEELAPHDDGIHTYISVKFPLFDTEGTPYAICGVSTDITERKRMEEELNRSLAKLRSVLGGVIQALASTVEARDPYTSGHQRRVANLARAIAREMGLSSEKIDGVRIAGLVHDIGKITIPAEILSKPGELTETEMDMVKTHPQVGYDILKEIEFPWPVAQIVLQHQERMDGSGYPAGLKGDEIIQEARILAVADVVEAMSFHRPYRPAFGIDEALKEISRNKVVLYDPDVVDACVRLFREKGFRFE